MGEVGLGTCLDICPRSDSRSSPSSKHLSQYTGKLVKPQEQKDALYRRGCCYQGLESAAVAVSFLTLPRER